MTKLTKKKILILLSLIFVLLFLVSASAMALTLDTRFAEPNLNPKLIGIADYITRIYQFAQGIVGVIAVGAIVTGAILYAISGGNPDKQREAKDMITSALWGIALLIGAVLILNTINPRIAALEVPGGTLPDCQTLTNPQPGINCLPKPQFASIPCPASGVITYPNGSTTPAIKGVNCLPECQQNERPCGPGEIPSRDKCGTNNYTELCAPPLPKQCPEAPSAFATGKNCKPGFGLKTEFYGLREITIIDCGFTFTPPFYSCGPTTKKASAVWEGLYYLNNRTVNDAKCQIYAYRDEEKKVQKPNLAGLKLCQ